VAVTITAAGLQAAYPQWDDVEAGTLAQAVRIANARPLEAYTDRSKSAEEEEEHRRYLEASAWLYDHPFSRDLDKPDQAARNPYRVEASRLDRLKGGLDRAPGWVLPYGVI